MRVITLSVKTLYLGEGYKSWLIKPPLEIDLPHLKGGLEVGEPSSGLTTLAPNNSLMYFTNNGYSPSQDNLVFLLSSTYRNGHGCSVVEGESFRRVISVISARTFCPRSFLINQETYQAPVVYRRRER